MTNISVPLSNNLIDAVDAMVRNGVASTKAAVIRKAIENMVEDRFIADIMEAKADVKSGRVYKGDLKALLKKMK